MTKCSSIQEKNQLNRERERAQIKLGQNLSKYFQVFKIYVNVFLKCTEPEFNWRGWIGWNWEEE